MPTFTVYKGNDSGNPVKNSTTKPDELTDDYILLRITASGVCGTDLHYVTPMTLGHEGIGIVEELGPNTKYLKKGDRVGWGYEMYGEQNFDQGSFASHAVWREAFLHKIPDALSDIHAAPLQCGGGTVFQALTGVKSTDTVGIIGIGGLGHMAIQFASKMGCRVIVLSGSDRKKKEALKLGAHEFVATKGADKLSVSAPIDRLIIPQMTFINKGIKIIGSMIPSRAIHRQMLDFAALHDVRPIVEVFPMNEEKIAEALDKLDMGQITYRAVLVPE
ncbi:hypothetical protein BDV12DRAFT_191177 [Aspergillus spectabilis]